MAVWPHWWSPLIWLWLRTNSGWKISTVMTIWPHWWSDRKVRVYCISNGLDVVACWYSESSLLLTNELMQYLWYLSSTAWRSLTAPPSRPLSVLENSFAQLSFREPNRIPTISAWWPLFANPSKSIGVYISLSLLLQTCTGVSRQ